MAGEINFQIVVPIRPEWRNVDLLRTSILSCLAAIFQNHDFCQSVGMIAGELLENAIKYGDWSRPDRNAFKLKVHGDERCVKIEVSNPVNREDPNAKEIVSTVRWLSEFDDPRSAYLARLEEVAARRANGLSRLGLARIAYEGNCRLESRLDNDVLFVTATSRPA